MRRRMVLGNWKMNGTRAEASAWSRAASGLAAELPSVDVGVIPAFVFLADVQRDAGASPMWLGAQDVASYDNGAYTGEVSASMLAEFGVRCVLVGHSERRHVLGESDATVAIKFERAQAAGLIPVLCLGETLDERDAGATEAVVLRQLDAVIERTGVAALRNAVLAYEPVWAIGTGRTASPEQAQAVHACIRSAIAKRLAVTRLGSHVGEFATQPDVPVRLLLQNLHGAVQKILDVLRALHPPRRRPRQRLL